MTWEQFFAAVIETYEGDINLRLGQAYMVTLHRVKPEIYNQITGTNADCFYDNKRIPNFMNMVRSIW